MSIFASKTIESILAGLSKGISELETFKTEQHDLADGEVARAHVLNASADDRRRQAARAGRVAERIRTLIEQE